MYSEYYSSFAGEHDMDMLCMLHAVSVFDVVCRTGSNGKDFMFLLKGHEDLRQDERVMQLFGLVNTLLNNDPETFKRHLR